MIISWMAGLLICIREQSDVNSAERPAGGAIPSANSEETTPLMIATVGGRDLAMVRLLLSSGADPKLNNVLRRPWRRPLRERRTECLMMHDAIDRARHLKASRLHLPLV